MNDKIYTDLTKIIFERHPRIKGAYCSLIAHGVVQYLEREAATAPQALLDHAHAEPRKFSKEEIAAWQHSALDEVLSRTGWRRYRNGDPLELNPSDLRDLMDLAVGAAFAARDREVSQGAAPTAEAVRKAARYDYLTLDLGLRFSPPGERAIADLGEMAARLDEEIAARAAQPNIQEAGND